MALRLRPLLLSSVASPSSSTAHLFSSSTSFNAHIHLRIHNSNSNIPPLTTSSRRSQVRPVSASAGPLDLTEDNVRQVLVDARTEFAQIFDASVGMTGAVDLAELDGPYVKLRLKGRFWHKRETVLARLGNYLKIRIPEVLEVEIEDEKQLDDSPENF